MIEKNDSDEFFDWILEYWFVAAERFLRALSDLLP
jgi:hypothetical protein